MDSVFYAHDNGAADQRDSLEAGNSLASRYIFCILLCKRLIRRYISPSWPFAFPWIQSGILPVLWIPYCFPCRIPFQTLMSRWHQAIGFSLFQIAR